jgi:hypothetical protein
VVQVPQKIAHLTGNRELGTQKPAVGLELQSIGLALEASRANHQPEVSSLDPKLANHRSNKLQEYP